MTQVNLMDYETKVHISDVYEKLILPANIRITLK